jgi:uncharacterized membrane protein
MNTLSIIAGLVCGVAASIGWQEYAAPWLRKRKQYKQRVASRRNRKQTSHASKEQQNETER